jgi:hypothetical protein
MKKLAIIVLLSVGLISCSKEQNAADQLNTGIWKITQLKWANGNEVEVTNNVHKMEFFPCTDAYTATCKGVYTLDYADTTKTDLRDTFEFDIKADELSITAVKNSVGSNTFVTKILRQRYDIEQLTDSELALKRFRTFADSTEGYIRAQKQ